ncbi:chromosome partitioning protein, ParB family [Rhizobium tibeticum]|uniref:Chromosome partitioning protein, ParB family n=1 Tax=Rhizobium tibeticum TaxID=501024 RepID=A0A1H8UM42_9HYPH|nr:plasmid partitioning protein RepB [Rhizobium tibeticum]SEI17596.1 Chromosome-partitioning protein ParB [Rhizobium tibeticum]SEP04279.1 chromosome partitioning protein, ParB family [Rhizobium tibeticum]
MSKRRDAMRDMLAPITGGASDAMRQAKPAVQSGALLSMNRAFESLTQDAEAAEALRAQIAAGAAIVELDPADIEASFVKDRLDGFASQDFLELQESLSQHGQILPVLVRPHPTSRGKYQIAFGHRRVEAIRRLGLKVKAVVRELDDDRLIIAQGKENLERKDLSFIERALFGLRLEERGVKRETILAALSVHKGNLSTMISIVRSIPEGLIVAIGPAPKIGRPRWEQLATNLAARKDVDWMGLVNTPSYEKLSSDERFEKVMRETAPRRVRPEAHSHVVTKTGIKFAEVERGAKKTRLVIDEQRAPEFAAYLVDRLPELLETFQAQRRPDKN